jgi:hypothetical protein
MREWYSRGVVWPHADTDTLRRALETSDAHVRLLLPFGEATAEIIAATPDGERTATIRFNNQREGRRRAYLGGLDMLRRVLAGRAEG